MNIRGKMIPCGSREAVVTVLSYKNGIMEGYLQHPRLDKKEKIQSLSQMILLLNSLVDLEDCPGRSLPLIPMEREQDRESRYSAYKSSSGSTTPGRAGSSGRTRTGKWYSEAWWSCSSSLMRFWVNKGGCNR